MIWKTYTCRQKSDWNMYTWYTYTQTHTNKRSAKKNCKRKINKNKTKRKNRTEREWRREKNLNHAHNIHWMSNHSSMGTWVRNKEQDSYRNDCCCHCCWKACVDIGKTTHIFGRLCVHVFLFCVDYSRVLLLYELHTLEMRTNYVNCSIK